MIDSTSTLKNQPNTKSSNTQPIKPINSIITYLNNLNVHINFYIINIEYISGISIKMSNKYKDSYKKIQGLPLSTLQPMILGKNVEMIATCDLFPNFHVVGIVYKIEQPSNICIIYVKEKNRIVKVDGGMNGLSFAYR